MSTASLARLAIDALIVRTISNNYMNWRTYPIVDGKRCKAEPVMTASSVVGCFDLFAGPVPTLSQVKASLARLVTSGDLESSAALAKGREVKAYSPAARFNLLASDGRTMIANANAVQCDATIAQFGLLNTSRVSVSDRVSG